MNIKRFKLVWILLAVYLCITGYLFIIQRSLIYFPPPPAPHNYASLSLNVQEATLQTLVLNPNQRHAILYFGGNAEAVEQSAPFFTQHFPEHTIYLAQYRGYGHSTGYPTETYLYADALVIFDQIAPHHQNITLIGRSLGSAVATYLAAQRTPSQLVLITPFDSLTSVAQSYFPLFPTSLLLLDQYNAYTYAPNIHIPTLLILAEQDQTIPTSHSLTLAKAFPPLQVQITSIPNRHHNNLSNHPQYTQQLTAFILNLPTSQ